MTTCVFVIGVSGCGKTTVGKTLADALNKPFVEGDDYHPAANIEKMSNGIALDDADRWPWLEALAQKTAQQAQTNGLAVSACSGLKQAYRTFLTSHVSATVAGAKTQFVFLSGSKQLIASRMSTRADHFMPTALLDSQFATLEAPQNNGNTVVVDIGLPVATIVQQLSTMLTTPS